jgi:hypothetical protein
MKAAIDQKKVRRAGSITNQASNNSNNCENNNNVFEVFIKTKVRYSRAESSSKFDQRHRQIYAHIHVTIKAKAKAAINRTSS